MYAAAKSQNPLDQVLSVYQKSWLVEDLLMKADKMSMAASLELRVPFLDYRLVEWANRQPIGVKIGRLGVAERHETRASAICQKPAPSRDYRSAEAGISGPGVSMAGRRWTSAAGQWNI